MESAEPLMTAKQACEALGVLPATLYAYVSRGLIRSHVEPRNSGKGARGKRYLAADIEALRHKKALRAAPERVSLDSLDWGMPVLASTISTIVGGRLYYRGLPLNDLQGLRPEALTALLWQRPTGELAQAWLPPPALLPSALSPSAQLGCYEQLQMLILWAGSQDLRAYDLQPDAVLATSVRILKTAFAQVSGQTEASDLLGYFGELDPARLRLLQTLLLVSADHELNTSTFTARCVASARATPWAAVSAALAALAGRRHGGSTRLTEALFQHCERADSATAGLRRWLQQNETLPGCGHRLYPQGDPRWELVAEVLAQDFATHRDLDLARAIAAALAELGQPPPNLDFALVVAARVLAWPGAEALVWFALGRLMGWLAHIQEQYGQALLIRPRAVAEPF